MGWRVLDKPDDITSSIDEVKGETAVRFGAAENPSAAVIIDDGWDDGGDGV